jgi:predicted ATP-binding protein involved in virulence
VKSKLTEPPRKSVRTILGSLEWRWPTLAMLGVLLGLALMATAAIRLYVLPPNGNDRRWAEFFVATLGAFSILVVTVVTWQLKLRISRDRILTDLTLEQTRHALGQLSEGDFETFDRVRQLREEKEKIALEANLRSRYAIDRFEARNIRLFSQATWELQPGVNVLLGRNGFGKSLLLRALVGMLQRDDDATSSLFTETADTDSQVAGSESHMTVCLRRDNEIVNVRRNSVRFVEARGKVPVLAVPDLRFFDRTQRTVEPGEGDTWDIRTHGAEHFLRQTPYGSVVQALLYELCLDYWEHGRDFDRPSFHFVQECIRRLSQYDFRFHSIERRGRTGFEVKVFTDGNTEPMPIQQASQGTLSVVAMFGIIRSYLRAVSGQPGDSVVHPASAIVVIDEADAHLHPTWQQKVPSVLKDLFPNVQFVLTAHSPLFVAGCWKREVAVLRRRPPGGAKDGFLIEQLDADFVGASASDIYARVFEVEELDDTYREYATKATLPRNTDRLRRLSGKPRELLSTSDANELDALVEEGRRIRRVEEVRERRLEASDTELEMEKLRSRILQLETQIEKDIGDAAQ